MSISIFLYNFSWSLNRLTRNTRIALFCRRRQIPDLGLYLELEYLSSVYSSDGNGHRRSTRAAARRQLPATTKTSLSLFISHFDIAITAVAYSSLQTHLGSNYWLHSEPVTRVLGFFSLLVPSLRLDAGSLGLTPRPWQWPACILFVYFCTR
jgi:hypothetical protein